jgi:uncharacterized membrane protein YjgN (DUF898 family)
MFADNLRLEAAMTITRNLNRQFAKVAFEVFSAFAVAGIAGGISDGFMLGMAQVFGHFSFQGTFNQRLG